MSRIVKIAKSFFSGKIISTIKIRLFQAHEVKKRRIKYWTCLTEKRLQVLSKETLSSSEKEAVSEYWGRKWKFKVNPLFHTFYKAATGKFDVRFIPDDIYYTYIDPYFNDWSLGRHLDNKTNYRIYFPDVHQPHLLGYRTNNFWFDSKGTMTTLEGLLTSILQKKVNCFVKAATNSMGGHGVFYIDGGGGRIMERILNHVLSIPGDIVIQEELKQSKVTSSINSSSVNTIRIMTFLRKDGTVKICSSSLRMGLAGSKVDNASSGGITVGVNADGRLKRKAYSPSGKAFIEHPTSKVIFEHITLPNYDKVIEIVESMAKVMPMFRLISWDIALDENDSPILIEANLYVGELEFHQLNNGPIFGDETDEILQEIQDNPKHIIYPI